MKRTAIKKVFKFTLMIAIAKHGIFSLGKAKDKHLEIHGYRFSSKSLVTLVIQ